MKTQYLVYFITKICLKGPDGIVPVGLHCVHCMQVCVCVCTNCWLCTCPRRALLVPAPVFDVVCSHLCVFVCLSVCPSACLGGCVCFAWLDASVSVFMRMCGWDRERESVHVRAASASQRTDNQAMPQRSVGRRGGAEQSLHYHRSSLETETKTHLCLHMHIH